MHLVAQRLQRAGIDQATIAIYDLDNAPVVFGVLNQHKLVLLYSGVNVEDNLALLQELNQLAVLTHLRLASVEVSFGAALFYRVRHTAGVRDPAARSRSLCTTVHDCCSSASSKTVTTVLCAHLHCFASGAFARCTDDLFASGG